MQKWMFYCHKFRVRFNKGCVSAQLGFDIKILSASIAAEQVTYDSRVARLRTVESYLLEKSTIGTPKDPKSWIQGEVTAQFLDVGEGGIVFIAGKAAWVLALGGSAKHLVGAAKPEHVEIPMSFAFGLAERIRFLAEKKAHLIDDSPEAMQIEALNFAGWAAPILWVRRKATGPALRIKFLAKRLASEVCDNTQVTLASPLYVEHADDA